MQANEVSNVPVNGEYFILTYVHGWCYNTKAVADRPQTVEYSAICRLPEELIGKKSYEKGS